MMINYLDSELTFSVSKKYYKLILIGKDETERQRVRDRDSEPLRRKHSIMINILKSMIPHGTRRVACVFSVNLMCFLNLLSFYFYIKIVYSEFLYSCA